MRFDHALQDATRLRFLSPGAEPPEGLTTLKVDLSAFFVVVSNVGRSEALLLLVVRALRVRTGLLALRVNDLAWMLRVSNRRVIRWLDRLVRERIVVYHVEEFWGVDTVIVEIVGVDPVARPTLSVHQELPTHWFVQVLPIVGRTTFTVFLYFLWCEPNRPTLHLDHLHATVRLRGRLHAHWHVRRLKRRRLIGAGRDGGLLVRDPSPPTQLQRLHLRYLALPFLRRALVHVCLLALLLGLALGILLLALY
ncbi:MAG TPA: hypothetical protein VF701_22230 [Thermoanaerobaculia bacterium]